MTSLIATLQTLTQVGKHGVTRRRLRIALFAILLVCSGILANAAMSATTTAAKDGVPEAPPTENFTVVTESARFGTIIAYAPNGSVYYYNNSHTKYFDVDPVANTSMTVEYTVTDNIYTKGPHCSSPPCTRNAIERVNLSTGNVTEIYAQYAPQENSAEWHDADRINDSHVVVADMVDDEVYLVDTRTGMLEWTWQAQSDYPVTGGGPYPGDWAHINDVEVLENGRVMISLRNQDQVVFIDPQTGLNESMTLGSDGNHSVLFAQHNPDYIPGDRGGPAVVLADSENGRVLEYQRENGTWNRTWVWSDSRMQWPRDADRLPNGNTLITDTNGKRLLEVNEQGKIVWQVALSHPYEAERLGTGAESTGGRSATSLGLTSQVKNGDGGQGYNFAGFGWTIDIIRDVFPARVVNAAIYVSPVWIGPAELGPAVIGILTVIVWGGLEGWWFLQSRNVGLRLPFYRTEK